MKDKIVIIGANDFQNQLIIKAKKMGYETHVFAWKCGDVGENTADYFYPISITEKDAILEECLKIQPQGVVSIASDLASITVNYIAEKMGLTGNGMESAYISTNKYAMRKKFEKNGLPSPRCILFVASNEKDSLKFNYPLIVKPTDRSGSRGIYKVKTETELDFAIERAKGESFEGEVLVEEYVSGEEYSIETISYQGTHHILAYTKKFTTNAPQFIETGHLEPAGLPEQIKSEVREIISKALDALQIKNGASHAEVKINDQGEIKIIEIGGRMGGDCIGSDLVMLSTGYDFVEMVIDIACGKALEFKKKMNPGYALVRFIFDKNDLRKLEWVREHYNGCIYRISEMRDIIDNKIIEDSSARYGYFIVRTDEKDSIKAIVDLVMK